MSMTTKMTSAPSWRWLKAAAFMATLLLLVVLLTGCGGDKKECSHSWQPATCTMASTCSKCGETQGSPMGHTYSGQSCTGVDKCIVCEAIIPATGHIWVEATCTEPRTCSKCGETDGQVLGHEAVNGVCTRCGEFVEEQWSALAQTGSGNQQVSDIIIGYGYYTLHMVHTGSKQFEIKMTDATGASAMLVMATGAYDGTVLMYGASPLTFDITADGGWSYQINKVDAGTGTQFFGSGDSVTQCVTAVSGTYHITHEGQSNFYVYAFYNGGVMEVVGAGSVRGSFDKTVELEFPTDTSVIFEIHADGAWVINRD